MKNCKKVNEHGIALITVLALLSTVSILVASAIAVSQYSAAETDTFSSLQRSALEAESAMNRVICLLLADRSRNADRKLGNASETSEERFLADGTIHHVMVGERSVTIQIFDAIAGLDISGRNPSRHLRDKRLEKDNLREQFLAQLADYVDADDLTSPGGMEVPQYRAAGIPVLPRNRPLQFREELFWLPAAEKFYPPAENGILEAVRLIPPEKLRPLSGRPNLYSTPVAVIAEKCILTPEEEDMLRKAFLLWRTKKQPLQENLPASVSSKLEVNFSSRESGVYSISIDTSSEETPGVCLRAAIRLTVGDIYLEYYDFFYF